jgi:hypothetical protein
MTRDGSRQKKRAITPGSLLVPPKRPGEGKSRIVFAQWKI